MTEVVLVRHGATSWSGRRYCGRSDPWLTAEGRAAVGVLAAELSTMVDAGTLIVSSPARRARQTATVLAGAIGGRIELDDRWRETDFGAAESLTWEQFERRFPELAGIVATGGLVDWPDGERAVDLERRVRAAWSDLVEGGEPVVIVSHGGPLRIIASARHAPEPGTSAIIDLRPLSGAQPG